MIRFDFTVSDADAENIFSIMRDVIALNNLRIMELMHDPNNDELIETYRQSNRYVLELIGKMTNKRVE